MSKASTTSLISWTIEAVLKNPKQLSSWEGWMLISDPQLGFWCEPCTGRLGHRGGCVRLWGHLLLTWAGLGSCQAGVCASKTGRVLCSSVERCWGRGSLGRWVSSLLTAVRGGFFPAWSALAENWGGQMLCTCPIYLLERCLPSLGLSAPLH